MINWVMVKQLQFLDEMHCLNPFQSGFGPGLVTLADDLRWDLDGGVIY